MASMTGCRKKYDSPAKSLLDDIHTTPDPLPEHAVGIVEKSPPSQKAVIYSKDILPQSRYMVTQRVYSKDDSTGLLYPAFVRKVMWGPKADKINVGSSLAFGENNEKQSAGENDEEYDEEDEDSRRWGPKRNCWHYYVHFMGWAVKWDRWVQEKHLYEDSAFTVSLSKLLSGEYNKVKPKKKGQKMSLLQLATWMTRTIELEAELRTAEREVNTGGNEEKKCDHAASDISDTVTADGKSDKNDEAVYCKTSANTDKLVEEVKDRKSCKSKPAKKRAIDSDVVVEDAINEQALQITAVMLQKQAQLYERGLKMKQKKLLSDQLTLPFNLKKILVEEWEVITQCSMVHNVPCKIPVREALDRYLESKLKPLRVEREKGSADGKFSDAGSAVDASDEKYTQVDKPVGSDGNTAMEDEDESLGKEWIEMVEGIALFFDQALPVNLLFSEERGQYAYVRSQILAQRRNSVASTAKGNGCGVAIKQENGDSDHFSATTVANTVTASSESSAVVPSRSDDKSPPQNLLPERMSEIYGCEHLLRLFLRLPGVVAESPTITGMESRRIFSRIGDFIRYLQKNQSSLFQSSFRKPIVGELRRVGHKRARDK
jgi:hypothetical protein